jgi:hypothetical protein
MTCQRLEDRDLLAELVEAPDRHTQHCPDCSARVRGYQRIAGWIAEGKTSHRAPADWRRRTLAQLRAAASAAAPGPSAPSAPSAPPQPRTRASSPLAEVTGPDPAPDPTRADPERPDPERLDPERSRALSSSATRRKPPLLAVFALASAAIIAIALVAAMTRSRGSTVRIAIGTEPTRSPSIPRPGEPSHSPSIPRPGEPSLSPSSPPSVLPPDEPPPGPAVAPSIDPSIDRSIDPSVGTRPPTNPAASHPPRAPNPIRRTHGSTRPAGPPRDDSPGQRRGATVTIDIPPPDPVGPAQPTIDVAIDTTPAGARIALDGILLGTTPYRGTLPRSGRQLKLAIWLADFVDEVITVDTSRAITRHIQLVPIQHAP